LDNMTWQVDKEAKEWSDKLPAELKTRLDAAVERARKALRGDDMNEIKAAQEELNRAFSEAGQSFYAQNQASQGPQGGGPTSGGATPPQGESSQPAGGRPAEDVVEADYEIVD